MPVPTLELENGAIVTETAAIALMVLDRRPDLAPPVGQAERQQFQRLLIWFVANVYPTFTYADYPERWVPDAPEQLKKNCIEYRKSLYLWFDSQLSASPYAFGQQLTLLDVYIAVVRTRGRVMSGLPPTHLISPPSRMPSARCQNCTRC